MCRLNVRLPEFLLALSLVAPAVCGSQEPPLVAIELECLPNTLDGCADCACRARGEIDPGTAQAWWIVFGIARPDAEGGWEPVVASTHCARGSFENVKPDFRRTVGIPYLVVDVTASAGASRSGRVELKARSTIGRLTGFNSEGEPVYETTTDSRNLGIAGRSEITLPVLLPDERERQSFGVHEVLLRLKADTLAPSPAAGYGVVSVSADVPGAEILLDDGFVGRVAEGSPTVLDNVLAGQRVVRVRDFSGREARREVTVETGKTVDVSLDLLKLGTAEAAVALVPIGKNPHGYDEYWRVKDGSMLVRVPAGEFLMGSPEATGQPDERPRRSVSVSSFLIDKTEVTWRQFRRFAEATGAELPRTPVFGDPDGYPVSFVLWDEARAYCEWAGGRLPTEAEWEKAARGTDGRTYPWGDGWDPRRCNLISGGLHQPEDVGSHPECVSPYGVLDQSGSMWEWCADWYAEDAYAEGRSDDPRGPDSGRLRVKRGGAWMSQPNWVRTAYRGKGSPTSRNADHGFRCAHDIED
jgi:formylglycine-generating enzyme required for sulfatase activity